MEYVRTINRPEIVFFSSESVIIIYHLKSIKTITNQDSTMISGRHWNDHEWLGIIPKRPIFRQIEGASWS